MRPARFWTGLVVVGGLGMAVLAAIPGGRPAPSGRVEGTVAYHGRPLAGGAVFFTPEGSADSVGMMARIDEEGRFECDPRWRRDREGRMWYRIDILPAPPGSAPSPPPVH